MLALTNRMRANPEGELSLLLNSGDRNIDSAIEFFNVDIAILTQQWSQLSPAAPLAWSTFLNTSAETHNGFMIREDQQSHNLPDEPGLGQRITNAGYTGWSTLAESIFAFGDSVFQSHAAFAIDWGFSPTGIQDPPGHRDAIMNPDFREVGIDIIAENNPNTRVGPLVITQHFGNRSRLSNQSYLLGSIFDDLDGDSFYDPGEGIDNVTINITGNNFSQSLNSNMMGTGIGGYQTLLDPGQYQIDFLQDGDRIKRENITLLAGVNQQIDVIVETEAPTIDLVSTAFNVVNDHLLTGEATITLTLSNQGTSASGRFTANIIYSDDAIIGNSDDQIVRSINIANLAPQQPFSDTLIAQLPLTTDTLTGLNDRALADDAPGLGNSHISTSYDYLGIVIDANNDIAETDELNNSNQGQGIDLDDITYFPWDVDGNGLVTPTDAIYVINRLGQTTTLANQLADFDGSGSITPTDAIATINRLGYTINNDVFL